MVGASLSSVMLGQRGFSQYLKSIVLLSPLRCPLQLFFQAPDSSFAHLVSRQVMMGHVSQHILLIDGFLQPPPQVDFIPLQPGLTMLANV